MGFKNERVTLVFISITVLIIIVVQLFWNLKNYQQNQQYIVTEIQESLDNAIEEYFTKQQKETIYTIVEQPKKNKGSKEILSTISKSILGLPAKNEDDISFKIESIEISSDDKNYKQSKALLDSISNSIKGKLETTVRDKFYLQKKTENTNKNSNLKVYFGKSKADSLRIQKEINAISSLMISLNNASINYQQLDSIFKNKLAIKGINTDFYIEHKRNDTILRNKERTRIIKKLNASTIAKSTFLKLEDKITVYYQKPNGLAIKRSSFGILLSLLLSLVIIGSIFYLVAIIKKQKELALIKNDLISNITHEFKTPITTISAAIESITNFNAINDKEKTNKYLAISSNQIFKLQTMVEKLLETALLDSEKLLLQQEPTNIDEFVEKIVQRQKQLTQKQILYASHTKEQIIRIDRFHMENVVSNLLDNAVKYGGNTIEVTLNPVPKAMELMVRDNGEGIDKNQQQKIFEKFYRVPKGNTHDVKGFGIGLYYVQKIIEKHKGTVELHSKPSLTTFKISLPI